MKKNKLLVVCGPTATGKTALAVSLAQKFNGELINADSRQVYIGMDIGTGKDIPTDAAFNDCTQKLGLNDSQIKIGYREKEGIPIWLLDMVTPDYFFNVSEYAKSAEKVIEYISSQNKLPILVGGTGLYISSVIEPRESLHIPPNEQLRSLFNAMRVDELQTELQKNDLDYWNKLNQSDRSNPRRLIRALEINNWKKEHASNYSFKEKDVLMIGLQNDQLGYEEKIAQRISQRINSGMEAEVKKLIDSGYAWESPALSALGYKQWKEYFSGEKTREAVNELWLREEMQYVKRQMTWFKKMDGIHWFAAQNAESKTQIASLVAQWYTNIDIEN